MIRRASEGRAELFEEELELAGTVAGVGVVVAEEAPAAGEGVFGQFPGCLVLSQGTEIDGEVLR
ncbi:hypothetical protein FMEAI12_3550028 [Parafrankia sp. Ea1.12]|nr:hypothetical protein FMEAI12_3550028 [Parafrankia sp. Ea1.12]